MKSSATSTVLTSVITANGSTTVPAGGSVILSAKNGAGYIYQWRKNGLNIQGATGSTYSATTSGAYQVRITFNSQMAWSTKTYVTVGGTARIANTDSTGADSTAKVVTTAKTEATQNVNVKEASNSNVAKAEQAKADATAKVIGGKGGDNGNLRSAGIESTDAVGEGAAAIDSAAFLNGKFGVTAYPNPTNGPLTLNVTTHNTLKVDIKVELVSMLGQVVMSKTPSVENGFAELRQQLDPSIASGTYFIRVTEGEQVHTSKLVITQ
jgi:hypothetical protein